MGICKGESKTDNKAAGVSIGDNTVVESGVNEGVIVASSVAVAVNERDGLGEATVVGDSADVARTDTGNKATVGEG